MYFFICNNRTNLSHMIVMVMFFQNQEKTYAALTNLCRDIELPTSLIGPVAKFVCVFIWICWVGIDIAFIDFYTFISASSVCTTYRDKGRWPLEGCIKIKYNMQEALSRRSSN